MKKRWILVLALAGVLTLAAACGGKKEVEDNEAPKEVETEVAEYKSKVVKLGN